MKESNKKPIKKDNRSEADKMIDYILDRILNQYFDQKDNK